MAQLYVFVSVIVPLYYISFCLYLVYIHDLAPLCCCNFHLYSVSNLALWLQDFNKLTYLRTYLLTAITYKGLQIFYTKIDTVKRPLG